jgi:hypothetical protein
MANQLNSSSYVVLLDATVADDAVSDGISRDMYGVNAIQSTGADASNTFDIQGSLDGVTYIKIGSTIAADTVTQITGLYRFLRVERKTGQVDHALTVIIYSADARRR